MVLGLIGGPTVQDEPPLELSTAQYLNETKAREHNYVRFILRRNDTWCDLYTQHFYRTFFVQTALS